MRMLARYLFNQQTSVLALTLTALICLPAALRLAAPDTALTLLVPVVVFGVAGGFLVHGSRLSGVRAGIIFVSTGVLALFVRVGQIGHAIAGGLLQTARIMLLLMLPSEGLGSHIQELSGWLTAQGEVLNEAVAFAQRAGLWLANIIGGTPSYDPVARALVLSLLLWLLVGWASWRIRAKDDPVGGLLPASLSLALALNLMAQDRWPLWVHISAFLLLLAIGNLSRLTGSWTQRRTDFSESITEDSLLSAILIIIVVMSTAFAASVFSIHDVLDRLREQRKAGTGDVTRSGDGSAPASGRRTSGPNATLEGVHLITGGLNLSEDIVMYISTGDLPRVPAAAQMQPPHYYWRGATYQNYTGGGWNNPMAVNVEMPANTQLVPASPAGYRRVHATVTIPAGMRGGAYWTGVLVDADQPVVVVRRADPNPPDNPDIIGAVIVGNEAESRQSYTFDSLLAQVDEASLKAAPAIYPEWVMQGYLPLPDSVPERVRALARDITARGRTPYDRALAIETYLRRFPYSLEVPGPPSGHDAADYFLFDLKRGYCDYYATAMAVLARAAGLPARLVVGYATGSYDPYSAEYVVTKADAHAWTEIYFPGIGWIEFEPTASQPVPAREGTRAKPSKAEHEAQGNPAWQATAGVYTAVSRFGWWFLVAIPAVYLAWLAIDRARLRFMDPNEATRRVYQRVRRLTRGISGIPPIGETAREHAAAVSEELTTLSYRYRPWKIIATSVSAGLMQITDLYMRSLFAPAPLSRDDGWKAVQLWPNLAWKLALLNILLVIRRHSAPSRNAPSNLPGWPAG